MLGHVSIFDVSFTFGTFLCLDGTCFSVADPPFNLENLVTVLACFRLHFTTVFMGAELTFNCFKRTKLTLFHYMSFGLVLLLIWLGNDLAALLAFIVDSGALDLMHPELWIFNLAFTILTEWCFLCLYHLKLIKNTNNLKQIKNSLEIHFHFWLISKINFWNFKSFFRYQIFSQLLNLFLQEESSMLIRSQIIYKCKKSILK